MVFYNNKLRISFGLLTLLVGSIAWAGDSTPRVYKWTDAQGNTHYGDHVPPEHVDKGHSIINSHGVEVDSVKRAKTDEERAEELRQAKLAVEQEILDREKAHYDKILLSTYLSVSEIEALRDRRVELLSAQLRITQKYLDDLRGKLVQLEKDAQRFSPYNSDPKARPIDEKLARELSNTMNSILLYEKNLEKSVNEQNSMKEKFASDIRRFIELRGASASASQALADSK